MARHAASHRMDGEAHSFALGFQFVGELLDQLLRLGERHAVARNHDDGLGVCQPGAQIGLLRGGHWCRFCCNGLFFNFCLRVLSFRHVLRCGNDRLNRLGGWRRFSRGRLLGGA